MNKNAALCQQTTLWRKNNKQLHMEIWTQKETNNLFSSHRDGIGLKILFDFFYYLSEWTIDFEKCSESMSKNRKICFLTDGWIPKFFFFLSTIISGWILSYGLNENQLNMRKKTNNKRLHHFFFLLLLSL